MTAPGLTLISMAVAYVVFLFLCHLRFQRIAWTRRAFTRIDLFDNPNYRWPNLWDAPLLWGWTRGNFATLGYFVALNLAVQGVGMLSWSAHHGG